MMTRQLEMGRTPETELGAASLIRWAVSRVLPVRGNGNAEDSVIYVHWFPRSRNAYLRRDEIPLVNSEFNFWCFCFVF